MPEHSRHMNMPYDTEAHCGFFVLQSEHVWGTIGRRGKGIHADSLQYEVSI